MRYIKLGRTGLDVSPIALGCMTYGEPGRGHPVWSLGEEESRPLIKHAVEAGGTVVLCRRDKDSQMISDFGNARLSSPNQSNLGQESRI